MLYFFNLPVETGIGELFSGLDVLVTAHDCSPKTINI